MNLIEYFLLKDLKFKNNHQGIGVSPIDLDDFSKKDRLSFRLTGLINLMKQWLTGFLETRMETFGKDPSICLSFFNNEKVRKKEYHGRELLEMIQNAEDEAVKDEGEIIIKLTKERLVVANTGAPFTREGVISLMTPNASSKGLDDKKIGSKGLGFRSLLNWADSIHVVSKELSIKFSREAANRFLERMFEKYPNVKNYLNKNSKSKSPIAVLVAPEWEEIDFKQYERFATVIHVNFKGTEIYNDIKKKIESIGPGELIFLSKLKAIHTIIEDKKRTLKKIHGQEGKRPTVTIQVSDEGGVQFEKKWTIFADSGDIEKSFLNEDDPETYDIRIAVNDQLDDDINKLFSYFKTKVTFSFPALIHATFDLSGDRNSIVNTKSNHFIISKVCQLLIDTAKDVANSEVSWKPMKLLAFDEETENSLSDFDFSNKLIALIKNSKLFPTIYKEYRSTKESTVFYEENFADVIDFTKYGMLSNLLLHTEEKPLRRLLKKIGLSTYEPMSLCKAINASNFDLTDRAKLIMFFSQSSILSGNTLPKLLLDQHNSSVENSIEVFTTPEEVTLRFPENVEVKFLNDQLLDALKSQRPERSRTNRDIVNFVGTKFNLKDYSFLPVLRKVLSQESKLRAQLNDMSTLRLILSELRRFYALTSSPPVLNDIAIDLPTRGDSIRPAKELLIGSDYAYSFLGPVNESLIQSESRFLIAPEKLGFENSEATYRFMVWLGVKEKLEIVKTKKVNISDDYIDAVLGKVDFPLVSENHKVKFNTPKEFKDRAYNIELTAPTIPGIDEFISKVEPEVLITWLITDAMLLQKVTSESDSDCVLRFKVSGKWGEDHLNSAFTIPLLYFLFGYTKWLPTKQGYKEKPMNCVDMESSLISKSISSPEINFNHPLCVRYGIEKDKIVQLLINLGVKNNFEHLSQTAIYDIFLNLPENDPTGINANNVYRAGLEVLDNIEINTTEKAYIDFIQIGRILAKCGDELRYIPVGEAYVIQKNVLCESIAANFNICQIDQKIFANSLTDMLGVHQVGKISFRNLTQPVTHSFNDQFVSDMNSFKVAIYSDMILGDHDKSKLAIIKDLRITICTSIRAEYSLVTEEWSSLALKDYEFLEVETVQGQTEIFFLVPKHGHDNFFELKNEVKFCTGIVNIFKSIVGDSNYDERYLYSLNERGRKEFVLSEIRGEELLLMSGEAFASTGIEPIVDFWKPILALINPDIAVELDENVIKKTLSIKLSENDVAYFYSSILYTELISRPNLTVIRKLFDILDITLDQFNSTAKRVLSFARFLIDELNAEHHRLWDHYKQWRYETLKELSIEKQESFFFDTAMFQRNPSVIITPNLLEFESTYDEWIFEEFGVTRQILEKHPLTVDMVELFNKNLQALKDMLGKTQEEEFFIESDSIKSLILFGRVDEVRSRLDSAKPNEDSTIEDSDIGLEEVKKRIIEQIATGGRNPMVTPLTDSNQNKVQARPANTYRSFSKSRLPETIEKINSRKADIGFMGEYFAYYYLRDILKANNLRWLSGNAKMFDPTLVPDDTLGYDMRYVNADNRPVYVEVKSSESDSLEFTLTRTEYEFAKANGDTYQIILITDVASDNRKYYFLNLFTQDLDFENNDRFRADSDSFKIRLLGEEKYVYFPKAIE
ncbi:MAG: DUF3883 domain-containing protein [Cyclobacteriaceae bacterium]